MNDIQSLLQDWKSQFDNDPDAIYDCANEFFEKLSRGDLCEIMDMIENYGKEEA